MCKKVGTIWFPPRVKIDEENLDAHPHPSTVNERGHEPTNSIVDEEEKSHMDEFQSLSYHCKVKEEVVPTINDA